MHTIGELVREVARFFVAATVAFIVALVPERYKRDGPLAAYADARVHVVSGVAESAVGALLFISGMLAFGHHFGKYVYTYAATQPQTKIVELFGMGALAYVSYLLTPAAWVFLYLFVEGMVRSLEVLFHGGLPGLGILHVGMRLVHLGRRAEREARRRALVGPPGPDEVITPADHPEGLLEIRSTRPKQWSDRQVLTLDGAFYIMVGFGFGRRSGRHAYWYLFRALEEREVIRGSLVAYPELSENAGGTAALPAAEEKDGRAEAAALPGPGARGDTG